MLLLPAALALVAAGFLLVIGRSPSRTVLSEIFLVPLGAFLAVLGLLCFTWLSFPPVIGWPVVSGGVVLLVYSRRRKGPRGRQFPVAVALLLGVLAFGLAMSILDMALSTREFNSDRALLAAALELSVSGNLVITLISAGLVAAGVVGGLAIAGLRKRVGGETS